MADENTKTDKGHPRAADVWAVQCDRCFKWRTIPTQEEFEEIRSKFEEDPFYCSKKPNVSCDDPGGDIEYDSTRVWLADKPNTAKTPVGFKRKLVMRSDYTKMDTYYYTRTGKLLRPGPQVASFLSDNPELLMMLLLVLMWLEEGEGEGLEVAEGGGGEKGGDC